MYKKILRNSSYLLLAQAVVKIISFFYTIFLANSLGVADFGFYTVALAYFALISSIADFGFNRFLIREGAREPGNLSCYFSTTIALRFILTFLSFIIFALWISLFDSDTFRTKLSILAVLAVIPQSIALTFDAVLVAKQNLRFSSLALLGLSFSTTLWGVFLVKSNWGVYGAIGAIIFGQLIYSIILLVFLLRNNIKLFSKVSLNVTKQVIKGSLPYALLGVLGLLYFKIDTLMLSYIKGPEQTGFYGAAYKFLEAIIFVPSAIATALFPILAKLHDHNMEEVKKLYWGSLKYLAISSIPIFIVYILFLPLVIKLLLPQYLRSIGSLQILSLAIPFMFVHVPGALVLISNERYLKPIIFLSLVTLLFNIILNLVLIPQYGFIGASVVTVLSEALSFIVFFVFLYMKVLRYA